MFYVFTFTPLAVRVRGEGIDSEALYECILDILVWQLTSLCCWQQNTNAFCALKQSCTYAISDRSQHELCCDAVSMSVAQGH